MRSYFKNKNINTDRRNTIWRNKLARHLVNLGGDSVIPLRAPTWQDYPYYMCGVLLDFGKVFKGFKTRLVKGERNMCYWNVARLVLDNKNITGYTGFALSSDGMWRPHSWGVNSRGTIIETTIKRDMYFGRRFMEDEAERILSCQK